MWNSCSRWIIFVLFDQESQGRVVERDWYSAIGKFKFLLSDLGLVAVSQVPRQVTDVFGVGLTGLSEPMSWTTLVQRNEQRPTEMPFKWTMFLFWSTFST